MPVDERRQMALFRYWVKQKMREDGIQFPSNPNRRLGETIKKLNTELKLDPPITPNELAEIYIELTGEVVQEHFAQIKSKLIDTKSE